MTEEEHKRMEETHRMCREMHGYLLAGEPSRAKVLDEMMSGYRAGKYIGRFTIWIAGAIIAIGAAWGQVKGFFR